MTAAINTLSTNQVYTNAALARRVELALEKYKGYAAGSTSPELNTELIAAMDALATGLSASATLPTTQAIVADGQSNLPVKNSAGTVSTTGTASVSGSAVQGIALPATQALTANGGTVAVANSVGGFQDNATTVVANGALGSVQLPATTTTIKNNANVQVQNSAGTVISSSCPAAVGSGVLSNVKLPSTVAAVTNAVKQTLPAITGTYTNGYTFTVTNGVITAIVAS